MNHHRAFDALLARFARIERFDAVKQVTITATLGDAKGRRICRGCAGSLLVISGSLHGPHRQGWDSSILRVTFHGFWRWSNCGRKGRRDGIRFADRHARLRIFAVLLVATSLLWRARNNFGIRGPRS